MRVVPIFPLPETVLFPEVVLPLHLFEPRYRQMGEDVIAGNGSLVVVLLRPGWEQDYEGTPAVHDIATLGQVEQSQRLRDGRCNIVLRGRERVRLLPPSSAELTPGKLYRERPIESLPESRGAIREESAWARRLEERWRELLDESGKAEEDSLMPAEGAPFEQLVNHIASFIDVPPQMKQTLLEEHELASRASKITRCLDEQLEFWRTLAAYRRVRPEDPRLN